MTTDTFQPARFSKKESTDILTICGLSGPDDKLLVQVDWSHDPVSLPFTMVVYQSCQVIEDLVKKMFEYEKYLNINDWGDAVRDDTIEALSGLNDVLNEVIDKHTDLQVTMVCHKSFYI